MKIPFILAEAPEVVIPRPDARFITAITTAITRVRLRRYGLLDGSNLGNITCEITLCGNVCADITSETKFMLEIPDELILGIPADRIE